MQCKLGVHAFTYQNSCIFSLRFLLRISGSAFQDTCHYLYAMIAYQVPLDPFSPVDSCIGLTRSLYDQD